MPDRVVRVGILTSESVNQLSWAAEIFYRRLMSVVDDYGRYDGRAAILRANLYPLKLDRVNDRDIETWMREVAETGLIKVYVTDGKRYLEIAKFDQRLRAAKSKWPPPPSSADICQQPLTNATETETESGSQYGFATLTHTAENGENVDLKPQSQELLPAKLKQKNSGNARAREANAAPTSAVWNAYAEAYRTRYSVDPVRNAKVNGQLANLIARLGAEEAPLVAGFYLTHRKALYVSAKHPVDLLLRDAEGLRTEWATGRVVTQTEANQADRTQANLNAFGPLIAQARAKEIANG